MQIKQTLGNNLCVKLDPENNFIELKSGIKLDVDTSYEPEKHIVRVGEVIAAPTRLIQRDLPWTTEVEILKGDKVFMYFLAVQNCLAPEKKNYYREGKDVYIFIKYHNIYAILRDGKIIPVNGYILVEPMEDPYWLRTQKRARMNHLELPDLRKYDKKTVVYGKVAYIGKPNIEYNHPYRTDEHVDVEVGDEIVMGRIRDIPVEYEYHAKIDGGRKLYRIQRHDIMAKL